MVSNLALYFSLVLCYISCGLVLSDHGHGHGHGKHRAHTTAGGGLADPDPFHDPTLPEPVHTVQLGHQPPRREKRLRRSLGEGLGPELTPLYQGYGTHFSYVYVGTPPQRQSVIIDTGSHWTAFPCKNCNQCGKHTDEYFDPQKSTTSETVKCGLAACTIRQSYAEGSSWQAVRTRDKLWVGGLTPDIVPTGANYTVDFTFGCQTSETGLFRTQLADGIMGMSMGQDTLPSQLFEQKVVKARVFALCFRVGGGIMTLGGVNQRIHKKHPKGIEGSGKSRGLTYARLRNPPGSVWYTVKLLDIMLQPQDGSAAPATIGTTESQLNTGKGVIVDSGTTDTYLPASLKAKFSSLFNRLSGVVYTEADVHLSVEQLARMPNIVFVLEDMNGDPFEVSMPWTNYVDSVGNGVYAFRVYLSEGSGAVLGANFMSTYNVIFDRDNNRVGFAPSSCIFEDYANLGDVTDDELAVMNKTITGGNGTSINEDNSSDGCESEFIPTGMCSARCDVDHKPPQYIAAGIQKGIDSCRKSKTGIEYSLPNKDCHELCDAGVVARGAGPACIVSKWSDCAANCSQWRLSYREPAATLRRGLWERNVTSHRSHGHNHRFGHEHGHSTRHLAAAGTCGTSFIQSRQCNIGACPVGQSGGRSVGDYLVLVDLRVGIPAMLWSYALADTFGETFAEMFMVPAGTVGIFSNAEGRDFSSSIKLRFEIRLKALHYGNDVKKLTSVAEGIPEAVRLADFGEKFIRSLVTVSKRMDGLDYDRYGWLKSTDVTVFSSMSIPLGGAGSAGMQQALPGTDFGDHSTAGKAAKPVVLLHHRYSVLEAALMAAVVIVVVFLLCVVYFHIQLRREHNDLFMEKMRYMAAGGSKAAVGGRRLVGRMWNGAKLAASQLGTGMGGGLGSGRFTGGGSGGMSGGGVGGGYEYDDLALDEAEGDEGDSSLLRKKGRPKRKTVNAGGLSMSIMGGGGGGSSGAGVVSSSIQSLSSIVTAATNPRHLDRDPSHAYRNYDANYRYGKVDPAVGGMDVGGVSGLACAADEQDEDELEEEEVGEV